MRPGKSAAATIARAATTLTAAFLAAGALHAQTKIILQTSPEPTEIPLDETTNVNINPLTGDITATPTDPAACTGSGDCDAQVSTLGFAINPSTVEQGQSFTATFNQRGAWECERTGLAGTTWATNGFIAPFSQFTTLVGTAVVPGDYTLVYTCRNGTASPDATDTLSRVLTVEEASGGGGTPQSCIDEGRLPPSSWTRELSANIDDPTRITRTWIDMFDSTGFPNGDSVNMRIRPDRYGAFFLDTGTTGEFGLIDFADLTANILGVRTVPALVSMSPCPGDFLPQSGAAARCRLTSVGSANPVFQWTRNSGESNFRCLLPPNAEFYLNVTYVSPATQDSGNPEDYDWQCALDAPTLPCGHRMVSTFVD
jgi:hypothetical protein